MRESQMRTGRGDGLSGMAEWMYAVRRTAMQRFRCSVLHLKHYTRQPAAFTSRVMNCATQASQHVLQVRRCFGRLKRHLAC